jgi:hypothetical protein
MAMKVTRNKPFVQVTVVNRKSGKNNAALYEFDDHHVAEWAKDPKVKRNAVFVQRLPVKVVDRKSGKTNKKATKQLNQNNAVYDAAESYEGFPSGRLANRIAIIKNTLQGKKGRANAIRAGINTAKRKKR